MNNLEKITPLVSNVRELFSTIEKSPEFKSSSGISYERDFYKKIESLAGHVFLGSMRSNEFISMMIRIMKDFVEKLEGFLIHEYSGGGDEELKKINEKPRKRRRNKNENTPAVERSQKAPTRTRNGAAISEHKLEKQAGKNTRRKNSLKN